MEVQIETKSKQQFKNEIDIEERVTAPPRRGT